MKISPRTVPGTLCPQNRGAADWSWQSMLAYGCRSLVVVLDPRTLQIVQTVDHQNGFVHKVKWADQSATHTLGDPYSLRLAAADTTGRIIVWDVNQAAQRAEFSDASSKSVVDMAWIGAQSGCRDLLAVIHGPSTLAVWNADSGVCCWKKSLGDTLLSLCFDPFDCCRMALRSTECLMLVNDFSPLKAPVAPAQRFFTTSSTPVRAASGAGSATVPMQVHSPVGRHKSKALSKVRQLVSGSGQSRTDGNTPDVAMSDCLQIVFVEACRHHICLVYPKEILVIDLSIQQTVGYIACERNSTPFVEVLPCRQRDVLYCQHESGAITMRTRQPYMDVNRVYSSHLTSPSSPTSSTALPEDVSYHLLCQTDSLRLNKSTAISAVQMCPIDERSVALVLTDGRVLMWDVLAEGSNLVPARSQPSCVTTPAEVSPDCRTSLSGNNDSASFFPSACLSDLLSPLWASSGDPGQPSSPLSLASSPLAASASQLSFVLSGVTQSVVLNPTCLRMCPALTSKNFSCYEPCCAVGSSSGIIQIFNLSTGQLLRQYAIHTFPVKGIEWLSQTSFLSWSYSNPNMNGLVRNELVTVDTITGRSRVIRATMAGEGETPLDAVKISAMRQYFIICLRDRPIEVWDASTITLLRQMKDKFPIATALEWSPAESRRAPADKATLSEGSSSEAKSAQAYVREHLVLTDTDSCLRHYVVEGSNYREGSRIPPEGSMAAVSSLSWKGERLVLGDIEGNLHIWDLKGKLSKSVPTHRGLIKKVRFGPGRGNQLLFVQYNDGIDLWDAVSIGQLYSMRTGRDTPLVDVDWVTSDKPVIISTAGSLCLMDPNLKRNTSPMNVLDYDTPFFSPHAMSAKAALSLRTCLQHQPWNQHYTLDSLEDVDENTGLVDKLVEASTVTLPRDMKAFFPKAPLGTAQRCLLAARLFGDEWEVSFWEVALFYLMKARLRQKIASKADSPQGTATCAAAQDVISPDSRATTKISSSRPGQHVEYTFRLAAESASLDLMLVATEQPTPEECISLGVDARHSPASTLLSASERDYGMVLLSNLPDHVPACILLDTKHDLVCETSFYHSYELYRLAVHDAKRSTYEQTRQCAINHILMGQTDHAVQMLLETEPENDQYLIDCLRACLAASIRSSGASQSTIKLVATNFIANERLDEGVRLLCLIRKGLDACRYLQTYSHWNQSAWLAKVSLSEDDHQEVIGRFADHLASPSVNNKFQSVLLHLSLGGFQRVVDLLLNMQHSDIAACFIESCLEFGVLPANKDMGALADSVFTEYGKYLHSLSMTKAAQHYCSIAGAKGRQLASWISQHD